MKVHLKHLDNHTTRKVALLICNHTYGGVLDADRVPVGKVFEARHKTRLMEKFLSETLSFDSVKTVIDADLNSLDVILNELQAVEVDPWIAGEGIA